MMVVCRRPVYNLLGQHNQLGIRAFESVINVDLRILS